MDYVLDPEATVVRVSTYAEGVLAKLAHDLSLAWSGLEGRASDEHETATLTLPLRGVEVEGVLTPNGVVASGLSPSDRATCLEKMRKDVFAGGLDDVVRVEAVLRGGTASLMVTLPRGRAVRLAVPVELERTAEGARVRASFDVSIADFGAGPVKGPLGAFRVKDRVSVAALLVFAAAQPA